MAVDASPAASPDALPPTGLASTLITGWALLGGVMLLAVVAANVVSVVGRCHFRRGADGCDDCAAARADPAGVPDG